jgi:hypothetical protein
MDTQQKAVIFGALGGAAIGAAAGYLFTRGIEFRDEEEPPEVSLKAVPPGEIVRLVISIAGVLRSIAEIGERI